MDKKFRQVCVCQNCGNEAAMDITCSLDDYEEAVEKKAKKEEIELKGSGVCLHCGNEADMIINL
jgi:hypothetical protein